MLRSRSSRPRSHCIHDRIGRRQRQHTASPEATSFATRLRRGLVVAPITPRCGALPHCPTLLRNGSFVCATKTQNPKIGYVQRKKCVTPESGCCATQKAGHAESCCFLLGSSWSDASVDAGPDAPAFVAFGGCLAAWLDDGQSAQGG